MSHPECNLKIEYKKTANPTILRLHTCRGKSYRRKIAPLFADFTLCRRIVKRCRLVLRFCVCDRRKFGVLLFLSAPLGRLTPNEALPHTPQGTLSLDPASPLTPGLSLRFISRYARCCFLLYACSFLWSALLIPHSSLLIPHLNRFTA